VPVPRRFDRRPPERDTTRINERIRVPEVRVIGDDGTQIGVMRTDEALRYAQERDLDLVEVAPEARPPVCRVLDYSKYKYEQSQKLKAARKLDIKEIPVILCDEWTPAQVKAFYMESDPIRQDLALCVDVLAPEGYGEIIGGGQRASSLDLLTRRIEEHHLPPEAFDWYLDLRKYGTFPHSGFGMGIERAVAWICGLEHVRETIPFPRMLYRLRP
jgi:aspartyl/asparaginyl-tRNA synthetase